MLKTCIHALRKTSSITFFFFFTGGKLTFKRNYNRIIQGEPLFDAIRPGLQNLSSASTNGGSKPDLGPKYISCTEAKYKLNVLPAATTKIFNVQDVYNIKCSTIILFPTNQ